MAEAKQPHVYLVPGLGADGRLFGRLVWNDGIQRTPLRWIEPMPKESISAYALRLSEQIDGSQPFLLVGVSLGGIMAIEIAKHLHPEKIIIISSIKHKREKPFYFALGRVIRASIWPPIKNKGLFALLVRVFFDKISKAEMEVFRDMLAKTSRNFLKWAQYAVVTWDNTRVFDNLTHIHGNRDIIFPTLFIRGYIRIKGGSHYMVVNKARQVSRILNEIVGQEIGEGVKDNF